MAIAGKVAITPKGDWNADTTYEKLDLVFYENASYVATKPSTGVLPTDETSWMLVLQSASGADLDGIINGDIQVGNAKTLDGHEAYVFAKAADLANYFPKSGGIINGSISVASDTATNIYSYLRNSLRNVFQFINASGAYTVYDDTNKKVIISSALDGTNTFNGTASGNLPLNGGGTVSADRLFPIALKNTGSNVSYTRYEGKDGILGFLGFSASNTPTVLNNSGGTLGALLHTGNKPTGTYTGNGDATARTINTGGIGKVLYVSRSAYSGIVFGTGGLLIKNDGTITGLSYNQAHFDNGKLVLLTDGALNESGIEITYNVI